MTTSRTRNNLPSDGRTRRRRAHFLAAAAGTFVLAACANEPQGDSGQLSGVAAPLPAPQGITLTGTTANDIDALKVSMPLSGQTGLVTQTIEASWDESLKRISAPPTVPQNWTVEYYANGTKLAQAPLTNAQWDSVDQFKAVGTFTSQGSDNGRQVIINTIEAPRPVIASAFQGSSSGDGWNVLFDSTYNRVYNIHHHNGPPTVMCRQLTDSQPCDATYPISLTQTSNRSKGHIDPITNYLWSPTVGYDSRIGWDCVDLNQSRRCDDYPTVWSTFTAQTSSYDNHMELATIGHNLYSLAVMPSGKTRIVCLDMANGFECPGVELQGSTSSDSSGLDSVGTRLFALAGRDQMLECFDVAAPTANGSPSRCGGNWPVQTNSTGRVLGTPSADGVIRSVCADWQCFTLDGTPITAENAGPSTLPPNYIAYHPSHKAGALSYEYPQYSGATRYGPRVAWTCDYSMICCWNMATDSACSNSFPLETVDRRGYAPTFDPEDDNCIWTNGDDGIIRNFRVDTGEQGCSSGPPRIQFKASVTIPRLGCEESSRVFEYRHLKVIEPSNARYESATMTVKDSNGVPIDGWIDIALPPDGFVDLSELTVAVAGTTPTFDIKPVGLVSTEFIPKVEVKVVTGSPPEACWNLGPRRSDCPEAGGAAISLNGSATTVTASGTSQVGESELVNYAPASYATTGHPPSPSPQRCGAATVSGHVLRYTREPVSGAVVELLDVDGLPVTDPRTSGPLKATTGADGSFSFPVWGGYRYLVRYTDSSAGIAMYVKVVEGGSGSSVAFGGSVTSPVMLPGRGGTAAAEIIVWKRITDLTLVGQSQAGVDCFVATLPIENTSAACECPEGFSPNPGRDGCSRVETSQATITGTTYGVCAGSVNASYAQHGTRFTTSLTPSDFEIPSSGSTTATCTNPEVCLADSTYDIGYLSQVGVWACAADPLNTYLGFSKCLSIPEAGEYLVGIAGDNKVQLRLDGQTVYQSQSSLNFRTWNVLRLNVLSGQHILELYGLNEGGPVSFGAEIWGPFPTESVATPALMRDTYKAAKSAPNQPKLVFSTKTLRDNPNSVKFDTSVEGTSGYSCPAGFALNACGSEVPTCTKREVAECATGGEVVVTQSFDIGWDSDLRQLEKSPTLPQGWSLEYYIGEQKMDGAPSGAEWRSVSRVTATGSYISQGIDETGRQVIRSVIDAPPPQVAGSFSGQSAGDGWNAFFDAEHTRVFNIHHHSSPPTVMCRNLTDSTPCGPSWPVQFASGRTSIRSNGVYDPETGYIWSPTNVDGYIGWDCVDSNLGEVCETPSFRSNYVAGTDDGWGGSSSHGEPVLLGRHLYTLAFTDFNVRIMCFDLATNTECTGAALTGGGRFHDAGLDIVGDRVYALPGRNQMLECFELTNEQAGQLAPCGGNWPVQTSSTGRVLGVPSADGVIRSVCADWQCFTTDGVQITSANAGALTLPANFIATRPNNLVGALGSQPDYAGASRVGPRVAWSCNGSSICCWDMETDNWCSEGFPRYVGSLYAVALDPSDDNCIWSNGDDGVIRNYRIDNPDLGCAGGPPRIQFKASVAIPRLGCAAETRVFEYRKFRLITPSADKYTSARLTIRNSSGIAIPGWTNIEVPADQVINISDLSVEVAGTTPTFDVKTDGLTDVNFVPRGELTVVSGGPPQACWCLNPPSSDCPKVAGFARNPPPTGIVETVVTVDGTYSDDQGGSRTYTHREYETVGEGSQPSIEECSGVLEGEANYYPEDDEYGYETNVPGVPVSLLGNNGLPIIHPDTNLPITTVTDERGYFSFRGIWGGTYYRIVVGQSEYLDPVEVYTEDGGYASGDRITITSQRARVPVGGSTWADITMNGWQIDVDQADGGYLWCPETARTGGIFVCESEPNFGMTLSEVFDNNQNGTSRIEDGSYTSLPVYEDHLVRPTFRKTNGNECFTNFDCASGICVDGVCCNTSCSGRCEACNVPGSEGTCSADISAEGNGSADNTCNGIDENCNGLADDGYAPVLTTCGVGACANTQGLSTCIKGFEDRLVGTCDPKTNPNYNPSELCNNVDDNCNGTVDEGLEGGTVCAVPETKITSGPDAVTASTSATFTYFDPNTPSNTIFECSFDSAPWVRCDGLGDGGGSVSVTDLSQGTHILQVRSVLNDALKDTTPAFYTWTVDTSKPDTYVLSGPQSPSQNATANFTFGASIPNPKAYYCALDPVSGTPNEAEWVECDVTETFGPLAEGPHTLWVYVVNQAGVADDTPAVYEWAIDTTAPDTTITDTIGGQCICPEGYSPNPNGDGCFWQDEVPAVLSQTVYKVCEGDTNGSYAQHGTRFSTSLNASDFEVPDSGNAAATCTNPAVCISEPDLDQGYLSEVGVWACDVNPLNTYLGFSTCLSLPEGGEFLVGIAGDNRVMMRLDGHTIYESVSSLNFRSWNVLKVAVSSGEHILELFGQNFDGPVAFGAEIWGPFPAGSLTTPAAMRDTYVAAKSAENQPKLVFSTRNLRNSELTFDSSIDGASGYSCPEDFALDRCGSEVPTCVRRDETECAYDECSNDRTIRFSSYTDEKATRFVCRLDSQDWEPCDGGSVTYTGLSEGTHTVQVAAIDDNGIIDPTPATATFVVDTVEPETTILLAPLDPSQNPEAAFVFNSNEEGSTFFCKLDDAETFVPCSSPTIYRGLEDGVHVFSVYAADKGCKVDSTPETYKWTIDTTFPETVFTNTPPIQNGSDDGNEFNYQDPTDLEVNTFECQLDDGAWEDCDGASDLGVLPVGKHTFAVRSCIEVREGLIKCDPTPAVYTWEVTVSTCPLDGVNPTITCADDITVECVDGVGLVDLSALNPTATDACEPVEVTNDGTESYPLGTSPIVFTATDGNNNASVCVTEVTVQDTQAPVLTCGESQTVSADPGVCGALATITATATDGCDSEGVTILGPSGTIDTATFFGPGENAVVLTAVDSSGNKSTCETKVNVVGIDPLEILCDAERVVDAPADFCGFPEAIAADVKDVCAPVVTVKSASDSFPIGVNSVTFEASNDRGETDTCETKLTVRDVTAPSISCGISVDLQKLPAAFAPTVTDACSAELSVSNVACYQVNASGAVEVKEGCEVAVRDDIAVAVTSLPVRNADGEVIPTDELRVQWTVTAEDPSGNKSTLDCSSGIDLSDRDRDRDGIVDSADNCGDVPNASQTDLDLDDIGDACDEAPFEQIKAKGFGGCASGSLTGGLATLLALLAIAAMRRRAVR